MTKYKNGQPHGRTRETTAPEIELLVILPDLHGAASEIKRPQSYLNEARLSAIAIAIRLAILKERYIERAPRIMVLDDLLLSLDLGNRSSLLKVLLKKYAPLYQLIILTHDRVFFDCVLNHLSDEEQKKWCILEMYETKETKKFLLFYLTNLHYLKPLLILKGIIAQSTTMLVGIINEKPLKIFLRSNLRHTR